MESANIPLSDYHNSNTLDIKKWFLLVASYNPVQDQTLKNEVFEKKKIGLEFHSFLLGTLFGY